MKVVNTALSNFINFNGKNPDVFEAEEIALLDLVNDRREALELAASRASGVLYRLSATKVRDEVAAWLWQVCISIGKE